ncbi:unnamed protein product [Miscanthus lutarioriparius]|uniref:Uncharacterized protein n=1 Tax=Miscanthus lutarioriparius TaxID=422564 RepID=A0A811PYL4_9POAL|nr:unnamed protein product [Miscanthus lutarioriparius]
MAAPTAAVDTTAPPPPPSAEPAAASAPDQEVSPPPHAPQSDAPAPAVAALEPAPAPAPAPVPVPAPAPRKRKLEESGFHTSEYYKIRAVVADLRVRFVQVYQATDFCNTDAAREILKEINVVMDLSKKMRLKLGATSEPVKPLEKPSAGFVKDELVKPAEKPSAGPETAEPVKPPEKPSAGPVTAEPVKPLEKPSAGPVKNEPTVPAPAGENNQAHGVSQTTISPNNAGVDTPVKHDNSEAQK